MVTGIAILASGYSQLHCSLSVYHWQIIVYLAWFSSLTHLATLTFLRKHIHGSGKLRFLRVALMTVLVLLLAMALVPTGSECWYHIGNAFETLGRPARCCFDRISSQSFGSDLPALFTLVTSEVVLIVAAITRGIKLFRWSSIFVRKWMRTKPAVALKRLLAANHRLIRKSSFRILRYLLKTVYHLMTTLLVLTRAIFDLAESLMWEVR